MKISTALGDFHSWGIFISTINSYKYSMNIGD